MMKITTPRQLSGVWLVLLMFSCSSCENDQRKTVQDLERQVRELSAKAADAATDAAGKVDLSASLEEVEKMFKFEYGVFSFPRSTPTEELAKNLSQLGEQRWDCFFVDAQSRGAELVVFCKRKPKSVLRYLPPNLAAGLLNLFR